MPNTDFCAQVGFSFSIFPLLQVLVYISSLFLERFDRWSGEQWRVGWSCILIFSVQEVVPGFIFLGFCWRREEGKEVILLLSEMGPVGGVVRFIFLVIKEVGCVGFPFGGEARWVGREEGMCVKDMVGDVC